MNQTLSRQHFLSQTALAAGAAWSLPRFSIGKPGESANEKLNVAVIGLGGMGAYAVREAAKQNLVAFCDVDDNRASKAYEAHPDVPRFRDFRAMLDKHHKEIDAVLISTPDHTHFPAAMASMELGKHVFVQKPLAHDIWQLRTLQKAAQYYNVQTVMGNQGHCSTGIRQIKEWYDAGLLGDVTEIHAWTNRIYPQWLFPKDQYPPAKQPVPESLDWNGWLGPATERDYNKCYLPQNWRVWWDFGIGALGDIGCHLLDAPFWALDLTGPVSVQAEAEDFHEYISPTSGSITFTFPKRGNKAPLTLKWYEGGKMPPKPEGFDFSEKLPTNGILMVGTKNTFYHSGIRPNQPMLVMSRKDWHEFRQTELPPESIPRSETKHPIGELYAAIKGGPQPGSNFDYAAPLSEMCSLGAIALRTGKKLDYDPKAMSFKNASLNRYIKDPVRKGWEYGEKLW